MGKRSYKKQEVIGNVEIYRAWKLLFHSDCFCPYKAKKTNKNNNTEQYLLFSN